MNQMRKLTTIEQAALIETIGAPPLGNVATGSVQAFEQPDGQIAVVWTGVAIIPRLQYDSVLQVVDAEHHERGNWPDIESEPTLPSHPTQIGEQP